MLQASDLRKSFGTTPAVAGVSLAVDPGEIVGLLGPNGAGKSTTISMLCGLVKPDAGTVTIAGAPVGEEASAVKLRIGLVPQEISLYEDLSAIGNLELFGALYRLDGSLLGERVHAALDLVGLSDRAKAKPATFSGGMKRRLNIACALVHDPDVLLLDEPTVGVDPLLRVQLWHRFQRMAHDGTSILVSSHVMDEAERCDRLGLIRFGRLLAEGTVSELKATAGVDRLEDAFLKLSEAAGK